MIFELESHGGYARTVGGGIAYLDREAETYFVSDRHGSLVRVPVRDIVTSREIQRPLGAAEHAQGTEPLGWRSAQPDKDRVQGGVDRTSSSIALRRARDQAPALRGDSDIAATVGAAPLEDQAPVRGPSQRRSEPATCAAIRNAS